jgi:hypothetical protein
MRRKYIRILQVVILLALLLGINLLRTGENAETQAPAGHEISFLEDEFEGNIRLSQDSSRQVCTIFTGEGPVGYIIYSEDLEDQTTGFASPLNFAVVFNEELEILSVELISYGNETPSYMDWLRRDGFFEQWDGMKPEDVLQHETDIISGATLSCMAVETDMNKLMAGLSDFEASYSKARTGWILKNLAALLFLVFALLHFFFPRKLMKTRWILLLASILILGVWCSYFLSLALLHGWLIQGIVLEMQVVLVTIFIISVSIPLFTSRSFYCTFVCPFGAAQELVGKINKRKKELPASVKRFFRWFRPIAFFTILILTLVGILLPLSDLEPFSVFRIQAASLAVIILAALMLVLSAFISKPWCRYFCPTGMMLDLLRKPIIKIQKRK